MPNLPPPNLTDLSPYFQRTLNARVLAGDVDAHARLDALCENGLTLERVIAAAKVESVLDAAQRLRLIRQWLMMALFNADIEQKIPVQTVCRLMSDFARYACQEALDAVSGPLTERFGVPLDENAQPQDLMIIAMGKAGADELNVSSDLDIVFIHRTNPYPEGETSKGFASTEVLERIARQTCSFLNDVTNLGFVFRIDTRLRPFGESGPLICSLPMLENYLTVNGREWERFAWLKARSIAFTRYGSEDARIQDHTNLNNLLVPFIYRRYLDFSAIDALRDLHAKIRLEADRKLRSVEDSFDVKLGRGGIREIEFIAQLFQIIRGGREPLLRHPATVAAITALVKSQTLTQATANALIEAYWFLRRTEHMLQYREDQQTHVLHVKDHAVIAQMLGMTLTKFSTALTAHTGQVAATFDTVLGSEQSSTTASAQSPEPISNGELEQRFEALRESRRYRQASATTSQLIDELVKSISASNPELQGALRLVDLIETLCGRPGYLTLLSRFPQVRNRVLRLIGKTPWAANYLQTHPVVLDELLGERWLEPVNYPEWCEEIKQQLATLDVERQLDVLREAHHAQVFRLLALDIEGLLSTEKLSDHLSALADHCIALTTGIAWSQLQSSASKRIIRREKPEFAVIAYGKLGSKELGYSSDLDLVFLFDTHDDESDQASESYAVLAQKLSAYLSLRTSAGQLFDVDTRLRPDGDSGLIASSITAFEKYQNEAAWIWEHQALTRARFVSGDTAIGRRFEAQRRKVLAKQPPANLKSEIATMRQKMLDGHPNKTELFDIKHDRGGMVDIEFMVQYLVLANSHLQSDLLDNAGNIALLNRAAASGLIPAPLAQATADAYRTFRQKQHALRLNDSSQGSAACRVNIDSVAKETAAVLGLWKHLFDH
jgi:[glutamine synthetase] adenylyltransferase / [glutamine synthetase]-adenylyl-L-tyrosine phosphorylase